MMDVILLQILKTFLILYCLLINHNFIRMNLPLIYKFLKFHVQVIYISLIMMKYLMDQW